MERRDCQTQKDRERKAGRGSLKANLAFHVDFSRSLVSTLAQMPKIIPLYTCLPWETNIHLALFHSNRITSLENLNAWVQSENYNIYFWFLAVISIVKVLVREVKTVDSSILHSLSIQQVRNKCLIIDAHLDVFKNL